MVHNTAPALRFMPQPEHLRGVRRGAVHGFSRKAASRLRAFLFGLNYSNCLGLALTAPPYATTTPEAAFDTLSRHKARCPGLLGLVWRKEVTAKGVPHYHLAVWLKSGNDLFAVVGWFAREWSRALFPRPPCPALLGGMGSKCYLGPNPAPSKECRRDRQREACLERARDVTLGKRNLRLLNSSAALQYLCDHTSKHKAYQALTDGRAWGKWYGDRLPRVQVPEVDLDALPVPLLARLQRALGKMSRYWYKDERAPFGYRWSRPRDFRRLGKRVLFRAGSAAALSRLVRYHLDHG